MDYNFFLFTKLLDIYDAKSDHTEYDEWFYETVRLWNIFLQSKFNNENKGLYECITDYLDSIYPNPKIRSKIANYMVKKYKFNYDEALEIIDYDEELPVMIEEDISKKREHHIKSMAKHLLKNDEGKYKLSLKQKRKLTNKNK